MFNKLDVIRPKTIAPGIIPVGIAKIAFTISQAERILHPLRYDKFINTDLAIKGSISQRIIFCGD